MKLHLPSAIIKAVLLGAAAWTAYSHQDFRGAYEAILGLFVALNIEHWKIDDG